MANIPGRDANGNIAYFRATGLGTDAQPYEQQSTVTTAPHKFGVVNTAGTGYAPGEEVLGFFNVSGNVTSAFNISQNGAAITLANISDVDWVAAGSNNSNTAIPQLVTYDLNGGATGNTGFYLNGALYPTFADAVAGTSEIDQGAGPGQAVVTGLASGGVTSTKIATSASVPLNIAAVELLPVNNDRYSAIIHNASDRLLLIRFGADDVNATDFTLAVEPQFEGVGGSYEIPAGFETVRVTGLWVDSAAGTAATGSGAAQVTEVV